MASSITSTGKDASCVQAELAAGARSRPRDGFVDYKHWQGCQLRASGAGLEPARAPSAPAIYGCFHVPRPRRAAGMYVWVCVCVCVCATPDTIGYYRMLLAWRREDRADTHVHAQRVVRITVIDSNRNVISARLCTCMVFEASIGVAYSPFLSEDRWWCACTSAMPG